MRILIIENGFEDLKKSRIPLGAYFESLGSEVFYSCPDPLEGDIFDISMSRNRLVTSELICGSNKLNRIELEFSLDAVFSFRLIPNVLNYLASLRNASVIRVAVITGLGYAFLSESNSVGACIQRTLIRLFYQIASRRVRIVTQNPDDLKELRIVNGSVILGSGVESLDGPHDLADKTECVKLLFVGRLLKSKGILTALEILEQLQGKGSDVTLTIAGTIDENNPDSIAESELERIKAMRGVSYRGFVKDTNPLYRECNVLLFPSVYREGIPRVIVEGLRHGLTIITRDMPGCKETIKDNGYLMKEGDTPEHVIAYISNLDSLMLKENKEKSLELFRNVFCSDVIYPQYLSMLS